MSYVIINGNKYDIPEVDFDAVCELEERGINLLNMDKGNMKLATMARGLWKPMCGRPVVRLSLTLRTEEIL